MHYYLTKLCPGHKSVFLSNLPLKGRVLRPGLAGQCLVYWLFYQTLLLKAGFQSQPQPRIYHQHMFLASHFSYQLSVLTVQYAYPNLPIRTYGVPLYIVYLWQQIQIFTLQVVLLRKS